MQYIHVSDILRSQWYIPTGKKMCANRQDRYETFYELEEGGTDAKTNIFLILIM